MILVAILPGLQGKVARIQRVFPGTEKYRCHCPAVMLNCTFPEGALVATWFVFANGILENCDGYFQHQVENRDGGLLLVVNNTEQLESNIYSCTAVYSDGSTAESNTMVLPPYEDGDAILYDLASSPTEDSLNVSWDHDFKFCKDFSVFMDGRHAADRPSGSTNYYINNLQPNTTYHVTVVAMELGMPNVTVSSNFTTGTPSPSPSPSPSPPPHFCLITPVGTICFVLPAVGGVLVIVSFAGGVAACHLKCKLRKAEKNGVGPTREKSGRHDGNHENEAPEERVVNLRNFPEVV